MERDQSSPNPSRQVPWLLVVSLALLSVLSFHLFRHFAFDDPFITYRVARNLITGHGLLYNPGVHLNALTSPLHGLLIAALSLLPGMSPPVAGAALTVAGLFAAALGLILLTRDDREGGGSIAALLVILDPWLIWTMGMETGLLLGLAVWALLAWRRERWGLAGGLCALAALTRLDVLVLLGVAGLHHLYTRRRLPPGRFFAGFAAITAPWFIFSFFYFGHLLPHTLLVKTAQSRSGGHWGGQWMFLHGLVSQVKEVMGPAGLNGLMVILLAALGVESAVRGRRAWSLMILIWGVLHVIAYGVVLRVPPYSWYFAPFNLALCLAAGLGAARLLELAARTRGGWVWLAGAAWLTLLLYFFGRVFDFPSLTRLINPDHLGHLLIYLALVGAAVVLALPWLRDRSSLRLAAAGFLALAVLFPQQIVIYQQMSHVPTTQHQFYEAAARWIESHRPEARTVGAHEIGVLGYYLPGVTIIDQCGIPTPGAARALAAGDRTWWIREYRPQLIVLHPSRDWWGDTEGPILEAPWFGRAYAPQVNILGDDCGDFKICLKQTAPEDLTEEEAKQAPKHAVTIWELIEPGEIPPAGEPSPEKPLTP